MKTLFLILLCAASLTASAQWVLQPTAKFAWAGTFTLDSATTDTTQIWAENYRSNQPWALDVDYTSVDTTNVKFAIIISNFSNGAYSYYPFSGLTFPLIINPVADSYKDAAGTTHATRAFKDKDITFARFGVLIIKTGYRSGEIIFKLKQ